MDDISAVLTGVAASGGPLGIAGGLARIWLTGRQKRLEIREARRREEVQLERDQLEHQQAIEMAEKQAQAAQQRAEVRAEAELGVAEMQAQAALHKEATAQLQGASLWVRNWTAAMRPALATSVHVLFFSLLLWSFLRFGLHLPTEFWQSQLAIMLSVLVQKVTLYGSYWFVTRPVRNA